MYCPECRCEYREGFTECSDCHVPLLAGTPPNEPANTSNGKMVLFAEVALLILVGGLIINALLTWDSWSLFPNQHTIATSNASKPSTSATTGSSQIMELGAVMKVEKLVYCMESKEDWYEINAAMNRGDDKHKESVYKRGGGVTLEVGDLVVILEHQSFDTSVEVRTGLKQKCWTWSAGFY